MASAFPKAVAKALPNGKKYHCYLMYNYASRRDLVTADTELSLKFVEFLVEKLKYWGYTNCYYYDENAVAGEDVFHQNFDPASSSMATLVICTEYFIQNHWIHYIEKTVLKSKINEKEDNRSELIPIVLGKASVPQELAANIALSFDVDENTWHGQEHEQELKKLKRTLDGKVPVTGTERDSPSQDPGDGILRSEVGHLIANPLPSMQVASNITQNRNEDQMESLSSSVAAMQASSTLPLAPESLATSSQASQDYATSSSSSRTADTEKRHVMISYQWDHQQKALWIKNQLENNGFPIWIDVKNMGPKLHASMAKAVEGAYVVLLCMSKKYKESKYCEVEALYAKKTQKIIIPLKMEDFEPDNWLGIATVDYVYYDFSGKTSCEAEMMKLLNVLARHYKKELNQPKILPFARFKPQEETESAQDPGANQSTGSE